MSLNRYSYRHYIFSSFRDDLIMKMEGGFQVYPGDRMKEEVDIEILYSIRY
jgi:hypothetical protein